MKTDQAKAIIREIMETYDATDIYDLHNTLEKNGYEYYVIYTTQEWRLMRQDPDNKRGGQCMISKFWRATEARDPQKKFEHIQEWAYTPNMKW